MHTCIHHSVRERERERERERDHMHTPLSETETDTQTQTDRQTDRLGARWVGWGVRVGGGGELYGLKH